MLEAQNPTWSVPDRKVKKILKEMAASDTASNDDDESVLSEASDMSTSKRNLLKRGGSSVRKSITSIFGRKSKGDVTEDDVQFEPAPIESAASNLLPPMDDGADEEDDLMITPTVVTTSSVDDSLASVEPSVNSPEKPVVVVHAIEKSPGEVEPSEDLIEEISDVEPHRLVIEGQSFPSPVGLSPRRGVPEGQSSASLVGLQFVSEDDIAEPVPAKPKTVSESIYEDEPDEKEEAATEKSKECFLGCAIV